MKRLPRVLLIHANPFQAVVPVPPYGLERVAASAEARAEVVEILDPYLFNDEPIAAAVEAIERLRPDVIGFGLRVVDDCILVDAARPSTDSPFDVTWFLPEIRRLRDAVAAAAPRALLVAGGAAFSAFPLPVLRYLDVDWGVVGAGEATFARLLEQLAEDGVPSPQPGLVHRAHGSSVGAYRVGGDAPVTRNLRYGPTAGFPVRTRVGCAMACAYCLTANQARAHTDLSVERVLDEMEELVRAGRDRGFSSVPLFFADDEFNLPNEQHAIAVLRGIVRRGLDDAITWRGYVNPVPLSDELAELVAATNGHLSITVDTAAPAAMRRSAKPFRRKHLDEVVERLLRHGVLFDLGLIFGLPGETAATIDETVAWVDSLPPAVEVVYAPGARVYPATPLAAVASAEPQYVVGGNGDFLAPAAYSAPMPPRALAAHLADAFTDAPNVEPVGVGYGSGEGIAARAHRVIRDGDRDSWRMLLDRAISGGGGGRSAADAAFDCVELAQWNGRFDLAADAASMLLKSQLSLPDGVTRLRLRAMGTGFRALGAVAGIRGH